MAKEPTFVLSWLLLAPDEKTCAISPAKWASLEMNELVATKLIHDELQTAMTRKPPDSL